jgi:hypothetical protein
MVKDAKMKYEIITDHRLTDGYCGSYRYGKPEGVALHEPANEGLILNQIGYELRDPAANGIVHAWADDDELREISNTDYKCWGAGGPANARLVQIEVCRIANKANAIAAIDRGLFWAAYQLYWYDLACTDATKNGQGTVWTHLAITKFLGNTDHTDPIAYWSSVGISWDAAFAQIKKYYDALHAGDSTTVTALGQSATITAAAPTPAVVRIPVNYEATIATGGYSIDSRPWGEPGQAFWGRTDNYLGQVVKAVEENGSGEYVNTGLGWIDKRALKKVPVVIESILFLPNGKDWVIYPENGPYQAGDVISLEADGGSWFTIQGSKGNNLVVVDLPNFGRVTMYFDPDKGANITKKYA